MRKTTLLALLAAAAVGGWIALFEREDGARDEGHPVFGLDEGEIRAVEIERPGKPTVRLARDGEGFVVTEGDGPESAADSGEADLLLQNVASLRFEREIGGAADTDPAGFGLDPPELAIRVFPESGDDPLAARFGDETPAAGNRYLQLGERVLVTSAFVGDNLDRGAWDLRDKRVVRLDMPAVRRLRISSGGETTVEIVREAGVWNILRPYRLAADPYEASQFASRLLDAEMAGVAPEPDAGEEDPFGLASPRLSAELDLVAGPQEEAVSRTVHFGRESRTPPGVFARLEADPLVFVVRKPLFDALRDAAETDLASVRSLDLFRFAAFRTVALRFMNPGGETTFHRREGEEGREWTMERGDAAPIVVDTVAVEDLLYELNSTEAESVGEASLPGDGAAWTIAVTEEMETDGETGETGPETLHLAVSASGEVRALRSGDDRTLVVSGDAWKAIADLFAAARSRGEEP
ncbi:MAG: DUF4340 domain-containing protein [Acidobacteria bacterium]|nr:DUF4340 domain-containing protein [Acidobacteriota bacterium]MYG74940.1 DUF4340 domain-containing protein [Acidobacteriota bacterium]